MPVSDADYPVCLCSVGCMSPCNVRCNLDVAFQWVFRKPAEISLDTIVYYQSVM